MPDRQTAGRWQSTALVAITYVYFLIFAQFAFLARLAELGVSGSLLKPLMATMAFGGIAFSLLAGMVRDWDYPAARLRVALAGCAAAALGSLLPFGRPLAFGLAFLIGASLGILTVTLVANLRGWSGQRSGILQVALGTGLGYFACNIPIFFTATPRAQALTSALLCLLALFLPLRSHVEPDAGQEQRTTLSFSRALLSFTALVWLDSAAFYIIQHTPSLKAGTWMGSAHLWMNAVLHLTFALIAGWLLQRRRVDAVLACAVVALGFACLLLRRPDLVISASLFYPAGVSLYSVALVAYPSFLTAASTPQERARHGGWIYAVAGWAGSALGIGMGQNLGHVPGAFVAAAATVVLAPVLLHAAHARSREVVVLAGALLLAFLLYRVLPRAVVPAPRTAAERGRVVYISEGCIHCHSQYVRPDTPDAVMWGPVESLQELKEQRPPLIGNRRQGPDLTAVGARRSPLWLKAHLIDPRQVSGGSIMPSFAFLFHDQRGDDLVAYLQSLGSAHADQHWAAAANWKPAPSTAPLDLAQGEHLYRQLCATCHDAQGAARERWFAQTSVPPTDLWNGPFLYLQPASRVASLLQLERITRFGIRATDMPGHEYLTDQQIASIAQWLLHTAPTTHQGP